MNQSILLLVVLFLIAGFSKVQAAYDSNVGRWIQRDPIEERGGLNLYAYVANDPILYTDPTGEMPFTSHDGYFKVNCSCKGKINLWVIDEHSAPAAPATCGVWVKADGFVMGGVTYKIDGSTSVELDCCMGKVNI